MYTWTCLSEARPVNDMCQVVSDMCQLVGDMCQVVGDMCQLSYISLEDILIIYNDIFLVDINH